VKILFAATEAVPFCKTGGLGDVCGALPIELAALDHEVALVIPGFRRALESGQPIEATSEHFSVEIGGRDIAGRFLKSSLPDSDVPVYLVEQSHYFDRPELYRQSGADYQDNCERFIFFSRAVLEAIDRFAPETQIVHCHDWQTGLLPVYLKVLEGSAATLESVASVYTIHNLAYQGSFWHLDMPLTGLDWSYFNHHQLEFYGQLNFMKSALAFADKLTTVSPTYAKEIQSNEHGCGLQGVLAHRAADLHGILNGCDYREWNPETDPRLAANYNADTYREGKPLCKSALQREMGLPQAVGTPLLAVVGRLADQKGFDLLAQVIPQTAERGGVQWVVLGTGEPHYHELLSEIAGRFPDRVAVRLEFSNDLAHRIEAGADMFLMPSRYEPCGLNQLYSLKYGTVPIVRRTGGLADTVTDADMATFANGTANGFSFVDYSAHALSEAVDRALSAYHQEDVWAQLVSTGMRQDWSWARSARLYVELYEQLVGQSAQHMPTP